MIKKLELRIKETKTLLCVGLDIMDKNSFSICKNLITKTHFFTATYKINVAFYEALGLVGIKNLEKIIAYLQKNFPDIPLILDNKRGDVDHTNEAYASAYFKHLKIDAITLQPYLGLNALNVFFKYAHAFAFVLCRTSNPSSVEFQNLDVIYEGKKIMLWQLIAQKIINHKHAKQMGVVMGAHAIEEIKWLREKSDKLWFLVPGIGTQGGKLEEVLKYGLNKNKTGLLINVSRAIIQNPELASEYYKKIKAICYDPKFSK